MQETCSVNGKKFNWTVIHSTDSFTPLLRLAYNEQRADVLRITAVDTDFDLVIRIDSDAENDSTSASFLGPLLVIGQEVPESNNPITPGHMIRLRPRITRLPPQPITSTVVERIVQWMLSPKFRAVRVNAMEGFWQGYGENKQK